MDSKAAAERVNIHGVNTAVSAGEKNETVESVQKLGGKVISAARLTVSTHK